MKKVFSILGVIIMTVLITACGKDTIVGKYNAVEEYINGTKMSMFPKMELDVKGNNTATITTSGETITFTYDDKTFTSKDSETGEIGSYNYTLDGNRLILDDGIEKIIFEK